MAQPVRQWSVALNATALRALTWQHTRGSALLGWVKYDAEHVARQISTFRSAQADPVAAEWAA
jgi:hypothetical protein